MANQWLTIIEVAVAVLLIAGILLQQRSAGLGSAMGGDSSNVFSTKRGAEKIIFRATIVLAVIFFVLALAKIALL